MEVNVGSDDENEVNGDMSRVRLIKRKGHPENPIGHVQTGTVGMQPTEWNAHADNDLREVGKWVETTDSVAVGGELDQTFLGYGRRAGEKSQDQPFSSSCGVPSKKKR